MQVAFHDIVGDQYTRRITDDSWFPGDELKLASPVDGTAVFHRTDVDRVEVAGTLALQVASQCDRCCRAVRLDLEIEFFYRCIVGEDAADDHRETECREDDWHTLFLSEPIIELGALCREQVLLALPARILCYPACKGLCQQCGADLNEGACSCRPTVGHGPFAALERLKDKKDRNH